MAITHGMQGLTSKILPHKAMPVDSEHERSTLVLCCSQNFLRLRSYDGCDGCGVEIASIGNVEYSDAVFNDGITKDVFGYKMRVLGQQHTRA